MRETLIDAVNGVLEKGMVARFRVGESGGSLLDANLEFVAGGAHGPVGKFAAFKFALAEGGLKAECEFVDHDGREIFEHPNVLRVELAWLGVENAQRPQPVASRRRQGHPGVGAHEWRADDERAFREARVAVGIGHDQRVRLQDRVRAKRMAPRCLGKVDAVVRFEPLPVAVHEGDQGDGHMENLRGEARDAVKCRLRRCIQHPTTRQLAQARFFVMGQGCQHRSLLKKQV